MFLVSVVAIFVVSVGWAFISLWRQNTNKELNSTRRELLKKRVIFQESHSSSISSTESDKK